MIITTESCGSETRRVKKSEAIDGTHVRMKEIASENEDFVRWILASMEVNQRERCDVFAGTQALKVCRMSIARAASQRHTEHGHRKIIALLDAAMYELIYSHPP